MDAEHRRLESEAVEVTRRMAELVAGAALRSPAAVAAFEAEMAALGRKLASLHIGMGLIRSIQAGGFDEAEKAFIDSLPTRYHAQRNRTKVVVLPGGVEVALELLYYSRKKNPTVSDRPERGVYPALLLLGIQERFPPGSRAPMAKAAALLGSYAEAAEMLAEDGIKICVNTLRKVVGGLGRVLRQLTSSGNVVVLGSVMGRRIVVAIDGGRVRLREPRRGKTKKGRKRFKPAWREPRLFVIYAVDDDGKQDDSFPPIIDGSCGSCDELFALLQAHLDGLKITEAEQVLFVADGAAWIWRRVPKLIKALGMKAEQVRQRIDFWHAMEYLAKLADSKRMKSPDKKRWLTTQKKRLLRGEIGSVVEEIRSLVGPRPTKQQRTWLNYFVTNGLTHRRMDYAETGAKRLPIGSGAVESAVRRGFAERERRKPNLRVKNNATYWLRDNAETMIRLRGWLKAGRGEELLRQTTCVTPALAF